MNAVIGDLLPLALGVAISPVPIIAAILMLLGPRATGTSLGFLGGWIVGVVTAVTVFVVLANVVGLSASDGLANGVSWIKVILGVGLLLIAARQWRARPAPGELAVLPKWMSAIDSFSPAKAAGLGFLLAAVNPKNLALCISAGVVVATGDLTTSQQVICVAVFTLLAVSTVVVPVLAYLVAKNRMRGPLDSLREWLGRNNATVLATLLLVIGVMLIGKGIGAA